LSKLTLRERQIAQFVSRGLTNREIGAEIGLSRRTVETHIDNIRRKTAITSKARLGATIRDALAAEAAGPATMGG
jgi:DNA-binding NarL/FixJ family response regulator